MEYVIDIPNFLPYIIGTVIVLFFVVGGIFFVRRLFNRPELLGMTREDIAKRWRALEELLHRGDEMSIKFAIIEADKLLDHALRARGFGGQNLGERLKLACYKYGRLRAVWHAHLLRNRLVHEATAHVSLGEAKRAIASFKSALQELGVL